jgi:hypothetical protein
MKFAAAVGIGSRGVLLGVAQTFETKSTKKKISTI